jgi:hypothetical protein
MCLDQGWAHGLLLHSNLYTSQKGLRMGQPNIIFLFNELCELGQLNTIRLLNRLCKLCWVTVYLK